MKFPYLYDRVNFLFKYLNAISILNFLREIMKFTHQVVLNFEKVKLHMWNLNLKLNSQSNERHCCLKFKGIF